MCVGRSVRDGGCIADVVNWGFLALFESGFPILYEWTPPARTGAIGDHCAPSPPRRHTHSNRQRLVVSEVRLWWIESIRVVIRSLELGTSTVQDEERGDPCPGLTGTLNYRLPVAVNLYVPLACHLRVTCRIPLRVTCRIPLRVTCVPFACHLPHTFACQLPHTFACHLRAICVPFACFAK